MLGIVRPGGWSEGVCKMTPEQYQNLLKSCMKDAEARYRETGCLAFKVIAERMKKKLEDFGMGLVEKFLIVEVDKSGFEVVDEAGSFAEAKEKAERIGGKKKRMRYIIPVYCFR